MQKRIVLSLLPSQAAGEENIRMAIADAVSLQPSAVSGFQIIRRSVDARARQTRIRLDLLVFIDEPFQARLLTRINFKDVSRAKKTVVIVGAGPAGLFSAMKLLEAGIRPILLERGKDVRSRRRDLALLNREGIINPESNYCFGEGGAGAYSDGKLYTRSTKRGDVQRILHLLVQFGAAEDILYESHPHIGTNKLPGILTRMREAMVASGARFHFGKKVVDFDISGDRIRSAVTADKDNFPADGFILATGHSARDIFELLHSKQIDIESKPFALGVRIEHPQQLIDCIQYTHAPPADAHWHRNEMLPPAPYTLVDQVKGLGVFSFCMCPGGIIAAASTAPGELVVNGWSPSRRNNPFANSGIVVSVEKKHFGSGTGEEPLAGMYFQQAIERSAFIAGGGRFVAPAQRMTDFVDDRISDSLPSCSYIPGIQSARLREVLPSFIYERLAKAFADFGRKMKGFYTREAVVLATESRTSSPVRIPRDRDLLCHPQLRNLYPCGEGAGYAGGIVSAAMDGENVAQALITRLSSR